MILGGAFFMNGNVNPAAEANFFGDPEAADAVFGGAGDNTWVVGLDVTHRCVLTASDLKAMFGQGRFGSFLSAITEFYLGYHKCVGCSLNCMCARRYHTGHAGLKRTLVCPSPMCPPQGLV